MMREEEGSQGAIYWRMDWCLELLQERSVGSLNQEVRESDDRDLLMIRGRLGPATRGGTVGVNRRLTETD